MLVADRRRKVAVLIADRGSRAAVLAEGRGRSVVLKAGLDGSVGCASGDCVFNPAVLETFFRGD